MRERGFLREGYHTDLVVIDPAAVSDPDEIHSKCGWSPLGIEFHNRVPQNRCRQCPKVRTTNWFDPYISVEPAIFGNDCWPLSLIN